MVTDSCVEYAMYGDVQCAGAQGGQIELAPSQQCSDTLLCLPTLIFRIFSTPRVSLCSSPLLLPICSSLPMAAISAEMTFCTQANIPEMYFDQPAQWFPLASRRSNL